MDRLKQQLRELQMAKDYWTNPDKQEQTRVMLGKIRASKSTRHKFPAPAVRWQQVGPLTVLED